jgi:hypothetical protein
MNALSRNLRRIAAAACALLALLSITGWAFGQEFRYEAKPRAGALGLSYASPDPAPRMMEPSDPVDVQLTPRRRYLDRRYAAVNRARETGFDSASRNARGRDILRASAAESIGPGESFEPYPEDVPTGQRMDGPADYGQYEDGGQYEEGPFLGNAGPPSSCIEPGFTDHFANYFPRLHAWAHQSPLFSPMIWQNFNEFGGIQAFKGPVDLGVNGNFGFHKGVNWASPLWDRFGIGFQLGGLIAVSDFNGGAGPVNSHRDQYFVTTGLFRRAACNNGFQGGAAVDYLHDNFYVNMNLLQVRGELSVLCQGHEIGFWTAVHAKSDTQNAPSFLRQSTVTWQSTDQYNLFYRRRFCNGSTGRMWAGLTDHADGLLGCDATVPFSERWALQAAYNYLWPFHDNNIPNSIKESWGMSISLVWYPGYKTPNACFNPYRPLFMVADNNSFFLSQK